MFGASATAVAAGGQTAESAGYHTRLALLGTSGGPIWWEDSTRRGISSALVVGGRIYLIDGGDGVGHALHEARLLGRGRGKNDLGAFGAVLLTYLHSDHVSDYSILLLHGWVGGVFGGKGCPVEVYGPGRRGRLPETLPPERPQPESVHPEKPPPGTVDMTRSFIVAFSTYVNDRMFDAASPDIADRVTAGDIALSNGVGEPPNEEPWRIAPFLVFEGDRVRMTTTLVDHGQMFPSFAFRFDTNDGSVVYNSLIEPVAACGRM